MYFVFDMNLGYILQSVEYITCGYSLMLCITFGYVVLKTMWYSFDIVLCGFSVILYDFCIMLYDIWYYMLYSIIWYIWFLKKFAVAKNSSRNELLYILIWCILITCLICTISLIQYT